MSDHMPCTFNCDHAICHDVPIVPGVNNASLLFQRYLFLTGRYDQDVDPNLVYAQDNITDFQRMYAS